jgi:hypothetical protein
MVKAELANMALDTPPPGRKRARPAGSKDKVPVGKRVRVNKAGENEAI